MTKRKNNQKSIKPHQNHNVEKKMSQMSIRKRGESHQSDIHGITNNENICYAIAIYQLLSSLGDFKKILASSESDGKQILSAINEIVKSNTNDADSLSIKIKNMIIAIDYEDFKIGYQCDAHEFLNMILTKCIEELAGTKKFKSPNNENKNQASIVNDDDSSEESSEWKIFEPANARVKNVKERRYEDIEPTSLSELFCGCMSAYSRRGSKYFLEVSSFTSINLTMKECEESTIEDLLTKEYRISDEQNFELIHSLPKILLLSLKRFSFGDGVCKINNNVLFDEELEIPSSCMAYKTKESRVYELIGVINHIGSNVSHGHYTCSIKKDNRWFYCDDESIQPSNFGSIDSSQVYIMCYIKK